MTDPADGLDLPALERLCKAATPGPWHYWQYTDADGDPRLDGKAYQCHCFSTSPPVDEFSGIELREEDARFIAVARTALPQALATIRARDEEVRRLKSYVRQLEDMTTGLKLNADAVQARVAELEAALTKAAEQFRWYKHLHAAKASEDGYAKARRNAEMAEMCETALAGQPAAAEGDT